MRPSIDRVIYTVTTATRGALASAAFGGFILWMPTSAIVMLRRPLLVRPPSILVQVDQVGRPRAVHR
jgi:hypothetical protein